MGPIKYIITTDKDDSIYNNRTAVLVDYTVGQPAAFVVEFPEEPVLGYAWHRIMTSVVQNIQHDGDKIIVQTQNTCYTFTPEKKNENGKLSVLLDEGAKLPTKAHTTDAGFDLFAREDFEVPACSMNHCIDTESRCWTEVCVGSAVHDTGVHLEIPKGYVGFIKSKSGLNVKHGITAEGVIDAGYTGSIVVKLYNHSNHSYYFNKGDKITQLVIMPIMTPELNLVDSLESTERGENGFGSSGK